MEICLTLEIDTRKLKICTFIDSHILIYTVCRYSRLQLLFIGMIEFFHISSSMMTNVFKKYSIIVAFTYFYKSILYPRRYSVEMSLFICFATSIYPFLATYSNFSFFFIYCILHRCLELVTFPLYHY